MRSPRLWIFSLLVLLLLSGTAQAQVCFYMDFDDDDDPYTIRTTLPLGETSATVRFVIDVPAEPPFGLEFYWSIEEGCCNDNENWAHYGTEVDAESITFDPQFIDWAQPGFPTCTYCCPWMINGTFAADAPMTPGQRYFIGQADWNAYCDIQDPCVPATWFTATFTLAGSECDESSTTMTFGCAPTPEAPTSWGRIKSTMF